LLASWASAGLSWANGQAAQVKGKKRPGWAGSKGKWVLAHGHKEKRKSFLIFKYFDKDLCNLNSSKF
jgi:hypothetical protein